VERPAQALASLLVGLTGSGKTTYARRVLVPRGVRLLSLDEMMFSRHGRYRVDYPEDDFSARATPLLGEVRRQAADLVRDGQSVAVESGLWTRTDRDDWKKIVEEAGGRWELLYFPVPRQELLRRLEARNRRTDANALTVTETALDDFLERFEVPRGEGEKLVLP
jgi:predicted kinase